MRAELKLKLNYLNREPKVEFVGDQVDGRGGSFKLYNVIWDENPFNGSTVGIEKIIKLGIRNVFNKTWR
jgi:hypothetical protein